MSPFSRPMHAGILTEGAGKCWTVACASARAALKKPVSATTEMVKAARLVSGRMPHILFNVSARMLAEGGDSESSMSSAVLQDCDNSQIPVLESLAVLARRIGAFLRGGGLFSPERGRSSTGLHCLHP